MEHAMIRDNLLQSISPELTSGLKAEISSLPLSLHSRQHTFCSLGEMYRYKRWHHRSDCGILEASNRGFFSFSQVSIRYTEQPKLLW